MRTKLIVIAAAMSVLSATAIAYAANEIPVTLEQRLERIEKAIERIEARISGSRDDGMMDGCMGMMSGSPNQQWRAPRESR